MKRILSLLAVALVIVLVPLAVVVRAADASAKRAMAVKVAGVVWHNSFDSAKELAQSEGKLVLHLQMFGNLDDAFC